MAGVAEILGAGLHQPDGSPGAKFYDQRHVVDLTSVDNLYTLTFDRPVNHCSVQATSAGVSLAARASTSFSEFDEVYVSFWSEAQHRNISTDFSVNVFC